MVDQADFTMFISGTARMTPDAIALLDAVAASIAPLPNGVIIRGHTDAAPFSRGLGKSNWQLSAERSEVTRLQMARVGITPDRFLRIEGVADREPYIAQDRFDPRNRRMSITLGWTGG